MTIKKVTTVSFGVGLLLVLICSEALSMGAGRDNSEFSFDNLERAKDPRCLTDYHENPKKQHEHVEKVIAHMIQNYRNQDVSFLSHAHVHLITDVEGDLLNTEDFIPSRGFFDLYVRPQRGTEIVLPFKVRTEQDLTRSMGLGFKLTSRNIVYFCADYNQDSKTPGINKFEIVILRSNFLKSYDEQNNYLTLSKMLLQDFAESIIRRPIKEIAQIDYTNTHFKIFEALPDTLIGDGLLAPVGEALSNYILEPTDVILNHVLDTLVGFGVYRVTVESDRMVLYYGARVLYVPIGPFVNSREIEMKFLDQL